MKRVTGNVSDESGPMVGVTVLQQGSSSNGTVTDLDGNLTLEVPANSVLQVSYLGYVTQHIQVGNRTSFFIILQEDTELLDEVVVVGYGTQKKSDIAGAMVNVNDAVLREAPVPNLAAALQGLAAGVDVQMAGGNTHPGAVAQIRIRGKRSITATNDALIVVDGIPFSGSLNEINNDDIASVSVLKDASTTAIYGSRGANGVILITTKRGNKGKVNVTYSGYYVVVTAIKQYDLMNAEQFLQLRKWSQYNAAPDDFTGLDDPKLMTVGYVFRDAQEETNYYNGVDTNWQDLMFRNGMTTNHQVGISGGSERTTYNGSIGYYKGEKHLPGTLF
ncbi:MAG: TonB-dependent receptor plug domain-containing protein [Bacteroides sp.]|nr:TonB-dependent receptor plug domain-containing protein [Bacteroides sp.]